MENDVDDVVVVVIVNMDVNCDINIDIAFDIDIITLAQMSTSAAAKSDTRINKQVSIVFNRLAAQGKRERL